MTWLLATFKARTGGLGEAGLISSVDRVSSEYAAFGK